MHYFVKGLACIEPQDVHGRLGQPESLEDHEEVRDAKPAGRCRFVGNGREPEERKAASRLYINDSKTRIKTGATATPCS